MKAMVFDLGGVLVRISRSWEEAAERAGLEPREKRRETGSLVRPRGNQADLQSGVIDYSTFIEREHRRLEGDFTTRELDRLHGAEYRCLISA